MRQVESESNVPIFELSFAVPVHIGLNKQLIYNVLANS